MSKEEIIIQKIKEVIVKTAPNSEVYLFGSHARKSATQFSDWDILILLNKKNISFSMETKFMDDFYELELETGEVISPLIYSKEEWNAKQSVTSLFGNIKKDGIRIV